MSKTFPKNCTKECLYFKQQVSTDEYEKGK